MNNLTFEIEAEVEGKSDTFLITVPLQVKSISPSQAHAIVRVLLPNAAEVVVTRVMCQY